MEAARTVKDVSPHEFVKAYASHLKRSGKVRFIFFDSMSISNPVKLEGIVVRLGSVDFFPVCLVSSYRFSYVAFGH